MTRISASGCRASAGLLRKLCTSCLSWHDAWLSCTVLAFRVGCNAGFVGCTFLWVEQVINIGVVLSQSCHLSCKDRVCTELTDELVTFMISRRRVCPWSPKCPQYTRVRVYTRGYHVNLVECETGCFDFSSSSDSHGVNGD